MLKIIADLREKGNCLPLTDIGILFAYFTED